MDLTENVMPAHGLAVFLFLIVSMAASLFLFDLYRSQPIKEEKCLPGSGYSPKALSRLWNLLRALRSRLPSWGFSPEALGGFSYGRLALVSLFGLFLEMLLIRWVSSEIRIFAYFKNFVLIACYLGFGLGCYLCRRRIALPALLVPVVLLTVLIKLPWTPLREIVEILPSYLGVFADVDIWGVPEMPLNAQALAALATAMAFTIPIFALLTIAFIPIGQLVGWYLENAPAGIQGYTVNILGSLAGILLFSLLCFLYQPPAVWFAVGGIVFLPLLLRIPRLAIATLVAFGVCIGMASRPDDPSALEYWSPYQKLALRPAYSDEGELIRYDLTTNNSWYQQIINLSPDFVARHSELLKGVPLARNSYNIPYRFYPSPPNVLVLGAGMGNDVAAALRNGAGRVVAVEIDPLILRLGGRYHFEKPYDSERVVPIVDDARSYLQNATEQFDLVLFSLLDSHTTSSHYSNIRIDNYVYTREALRTARDLMKPDGVFIVKFQANTPWIAGRLKGLLTEVFGETPIDFTAFTSHSTGGRFFVNGSPQRLAAAMADPDFSALLKNQDLPAPVPATLTTDDWPYFYQHEPGIPSSVFLISILLVVLCVAARSRLNVEAGTFQAHFFFLGAGFMLMEVQIVSRMALLFGTTWMVNSIVIAGLLLLIVGANAVVGRIGHIPWSVAYSGLFLSLLAVYAIPVQAVFFANPWLRGLVATALLCLPIFFAGVVFIQSFAQAGFSGAALGSNLLGALVGGLLESLSLWTGLRSLLIVAGILYLLSLLTRKHGEPGASATGVAASAARVVAHQPG